MTTGTTSHVAEGPRVSAMYETRSLRACHPSCGYRPASAQTAALIGLRLESYDDKHSTRNPPSYRTVLITFRDGKARHGCRYTRLIVPRKDGFWRVASCQAGGGDAELSRIRLRGSSPGYPTRSREFVSS